MKLDKVGFAEFVAWRWNPSNFFFFFFFMNGNTERAQCALSLVCSPSFVQD